MASMTPLAARINPSRALLVLAALAAFFVSSRASADDASPNGYTADVPAEQQAADDYADTDPSALSDFRDTLAPYGTWTEDPTYGTVWVPSSSIVGADFAPYQTAGHWSLTDQDEWLWVSDYDWGYIPFHYGRWVWVGTHWAWIPGRSYAPAWVAWRVGAGGYIGWAPMPPSYYWLGGAAVALWTVPYAAYCFVPTTYVFNDRVATYVVRDRGAVQTIAQQTRAYKPATPSIGNGQKPSPGSGSKFRSPSLAEAGVPSSVGPKARVTHDQRAKAFSTRAGTALMRKNIAANGGPGRTPRLDGRAQPPASHFGRPGQQPGHFQTPSHVQRPGQHFQSPSRVAPPARFQSPSRVAPPARFQSPSRVAPPPHFQSPSRVAPPSHFQPPSRVSPPTHFQSPSVRPSRPSTPSFGRGGGGRRR